MELFVGGMCAFLLFMTAAAALLWFDNVALKNENYDLRQQISRIHSDRLK